jgi:flagellar hook-basal body complex protein FliE
MMNSINPIGPLKDASPLSRTAAGAGAQNPQGVSFQDTLKGFLQDVNQMQEKAGESIEKLTAGQITDVHQVMSTVQEANVSFNMMMEIRDKVMKAYDELMRMRL